MKHQIVFKMSCSLNESLFICFISIVYLGNGFKFVTIYVGQHFRKAAWIRKYFVWETTKMIVFSFQPKVKRAIGGNVVSFVLDPGINTPREQKF